MRLRFFGTAYFELPSAHFRSRRSMEPQIHCWKSEQAPGEGRIPPAPRSLRFSNRIDVRAGSAENLCCFSPVDAGKAYASESHFPRENEELGRRRMLDQVKETLDPDACQGESSTEVSGAATQVTPPAAAVPFTNSVVSRQFTVLIARPSVFDP